MIRRRVARQLELAKTSGWGGKRKGAGRKPTAGRRPVPRVRRPRLSRHHPVHVTLRMLPHVWNLRSKRGFRMLRGAMSGGSDRFGFRLCDFTIEGNHLHFVVEANDEHALSRGMQGLSVRIAKALNRLMQRHGRVFADRYHAHILKTPTEVKHALRYVRANHDSHRHRRGEVIIGLPDEFSSAHPDHAVQLAKAITYLLNQVYRQLGPPVRPPPLLPPDPKSEPRPRR